MTVSSTATHEFTIAQLIKFGYRRAGLRNENQSITGPQEAAAKDELELIVDSLQAEGLFARSVEFEEISITSAEVTAETYKFALSSTALDVIGTAMYLDATVTDTERAAGETVIRSVNRDEWQRLSSKSATGRPTLCFVNRELTPIQVWVWPIPDEAGTMRFQVHKLLADNQDTTKTPELQRYWGDYLVWELAHKLAVNASEPLQRCQYLAAHAARKLSKAKAYAKQRPPQRAFMAHTTSWSSR